MDEEPGSDLECHASLKIFFGKTAGNVKSGRWLMDEIPAKGRYSPAKTSQAKKTILFSSCGGFCANVFSACA
jgi:hypothetical protein